jgi:acetyl-CoA synthetase
MANTEITPQVNIDSILHESRCFEPPRQFSERAHIKSREEYDRIYAESINDPEKFWGGIASDLHWFKKWDKVLQLSGPARAKLAAQQGGDHLGGRAGR